MKRREHVRVVQANHGGDSGRKNGVEYGHLRTYINEPGDPFAARPPGEISARASRTVSPLKSPIWARPYWPEETTGSIGHDRGTSPGRRWQVAPRGTVSAFPNRNAKSRSCVRAQDNPRANRPATYGERPLPGGSAHRADLLGRFGRSDMNLFLPCQLHGTTG